MFLGDPFVDFFRCNTIKKSHLINPILLFSYMFEVNPSSYIHLCSVDFRINIRSEKVHISTNILRQNVKNMSNQGLDRFRFQY